MRKVFFYSVAREGQWCALNGEEYVCGLSNVGVALGDTGNTFVLISWLQSPLRNASGRAGAFRQLQETTRCTKYQKQR
jgi:hypothetical protein